uniref:TSA: Wollemia nobilis Ref_Wollemi_Transcript_12942_1780 transcribed RNA sequence n=1 Tax=Wollemia nobilis TaxID=56998 RepID=A0A0C9S7R0_9CONI
MEGSKAEDAAQSTQTNGEAKNEKEEKVTENTQEDKNNSASRDTSSPGKIFIGGLARETTTATFTKHFSKYGELTDSVIMKDRATGNPRGFGFVTYADPSVVDKVIKDKHVIDGKMVEIKRTIPRGNPATKGPKTKKIFVGGIPTSISEDEFKNYFSKFGKVVEHQIMQDHGTGRSRGFGFITFDSEQVVEEILSHGKMYELGGKQVEIKKAEPKKPLPEPEPAYGMDSRPPFVPGGRGGYGDIYGGLGGAYSSNYRAGAAFGGRPGSYGGYGAGDYGSAYGGYGGGGALGGFRGDSAAGYGGRFGSYGGSFGSYGSGMLGGYGEGEGFGGYGGSSYGGGYDSGIGGGYGAGGAYGSGRGGYGSGGSSARYHPYAR